MKAETKFKYTNTIVFCFLIFLISSNVEAQIMQITKLPLPMLEGTWRVEAIDQRRLKRPINNFYAEHFDSQAYFPIGTTFTLKMDGAYGSDEPGWMDFNMDVLAPIPKYVCPPKPFADEDKNASYHELCGRKGVPVDIEYPENSGTWHFLGNSVSLAPVKELYKRKKERTQKKKAYLHELGFNDDDLCYAVVGRSTLSGMIFIQYNDDTLLFPNTYTETIGMDILDPQQNYGAVMLIAKRIK